MELVKDPRVRDLVTRREFRISEEDLRKEFVSRVADEELQELDVVIGEGIPGDLRKNEEEAASVPSPVFGALLPAFPGVFPPPQNVHLRLEELKPLDLDWLTKSSWRKSRFSPLPTDW